MLTATLDSPPASGSASARDLAVHAPRPQKRKWDGPVLLGIAALLVAILAWLTSILLWNQTEDVSQPSLEATVAGWYQLGVNLQGPEEVAAKGVPILVSVLQNDGRSPLSIVGAAAQSPDEPATNVDAMLVIRDGRDVTTSTPFTLSAGETAIVAWLLPSAATFGSDAASVKLLNATTGNTLEALNPDRACDGILDAVCEHALVRAQTAFRDADPMWSMCVPKVRVWNRLDQLEKDFCGPWLNSEGWNAVEEELRLYATESG